MNYSLYIAQLLQRFPLLSLIIQAMLQKGWDPLLVGGSVRDHIRGLSLDSIQDHDIEVHGCLFKDLEQLLAHYGVVRVVGKAFGVLMLDSLPIDWSVPRMDKEGRKPEVFFSASLNYEQACARRDLTINAMCISFKNGNLIDPCDGLNDLRAKKARAPRNDLFVQDPLRLLRVARFVSCFDLTVEPSLETVCRTMSFQDISSERIGDELKLLLYAPTPSKGLRWLHTIGQLTCFSSELAQCADVVQSGHWHPEGDVLEHSFQTVDAAAKIASEYGEEEKKMILLYAALFHDIGKKETTVIGHDRISSHGHAKVGAQKIKSILTRLHVPNKIIKAVQSLILYHMHLGQFLRTNAPLASYKWLAYNLDSAACLRMLLDLMCADLRGRNPKKEVPLTCDIKDIGLLKTIINDCCILDQPESPLIKASDLIDHVQGKLLGDMLRKAYSIQINHNIASGQELKEYIIKHLLPS